jgi:hypothetical protein
MVSIDTNHALLYGGTDPLRLQVLDDVWMYNHTVQNWFLFEQVAIPSARIQPGLARLDGGRYVFLYGGFDDSNANDLSDCKIVLLKLF